MTSNRFYNTAIPVKNSKKEGYCDYLSKHFTLTEPISFNDALSKAQGIVIQNSHKSILLNGAQINYNRTDFGRIEYLLNHKQPYSETYDISNNKVALSTV